MTVKIQVFISLCLIICINSHPTLKDVHDFEWLTAEPYFIDKTELIALLFDDKFTTSNTSCHFLTFPYHFGKRKNLYMVQKFANVEVDEKGKAVMWMETDAVKTFMNLNIGKYPYVISEHLARYPVIFFDLAVSKRDPLDDILKILRNAVQKSVHDYKWLQDILEKNIKNVKKNWNIDEYDAKFFIKACKGELTDQELDDSLFRIAKVLFQYFNERKVILLIDEYEKVALLAFTSKNQNGILFYEKVNKILTRALSDGAEYFKKTLIFGTGSLGFSVSNHAKYNILGYTFGSTKRNFSVTHHAFLDDHPFSPYFGFFNNDIEELYKLYGSKKQEKNMLRKLYQGYLTKSNRTLIYNPSCIARFFQTTYHPQSLLTYLSDHWIDPELQLLIVPFMRSDVFREYVEEALKRGIFRYPIKKQLPPNSLKELIELANNEFKNIKKHHVDMFFTIAFEQGYFSHASGQDMYTIPNRDVELILRLQFEKYFDE